MVKCLATNRNRHIIKAGNFSFYPRVPLHLTAAGRVWVGHFEKFNMWVRVESILRRVGTGRSILNRGYPLTHKKIKK